MPTRLPSLTALRAFEAAARYLSFTDAANELAVTPAALSFQIKGLESDLGAPLFIRKSRSLELTDAGRILLPHATTAFEALKNGWQSAKSLSNSNRLRVTAGPGFVAKWLAPRIGAFSREYPDIELRLISSLQLMDLQREGIDIGIRFGRPRPNEPHSQPLMDSDWVLPFAHPDLARQVQDIEDILKFPLIYDESLQFLSDPPDWKDWFAAVGVDSDIPTGPHFSQADHAIDMALEGGGFVLARYWMAHSALMSGALVAPFKIAVKVPAGFRVVTAPTHKDRPAVIQFLDWLFKEMKEGEKALKEMDLRG